MKLLKKFSRALQEQFPMKVLKEFPVELLKDYTKTHREIPDETAIGVYSKMKFLEEYPFVFL